MYYRSPFGFLAFFCRFVPFHVGNMKPTCLFTVYRLRDQTCLLCHLESPLSLALRIGAPGAPDSGRQSMDALLPHLQAHVPSLTWHDLAPVASSRPCIEAITRLVHELEAWRQGDAQNQRERALDRDKASWGLHPTQDTPKIYTDRVGPFFL
jgi:hypothetical protein